MNKEYNCGKCGGFVGQPGKAYGYAGQWCHCEKPVYVESKPQVIFTETDPIVNLCPLTNSSHEKALVRVVEKEDGMYTKDVIQTLCGCGHIISEAEIKSK